MAELALVTFSTLALLKERTQHRFWVNPCRKEREREKKVLFKLNTHKTTSKYFLFSLWQIVFVTFADFLGSDYGFKQLVKFVQLFLLIGLLTALLCISLGNLHKHVLHKLQYIQHWQEPLIGGTIQSTNCQNWHFQSPQERFKYMHKDA